MDKSAKDRDSSLLKSDMDARSHASGVSSNHISGVGSNHSQPSSGTHSRSQRSYDKPFSRQDVQTLGLLGKNCFH